MMSAIEKGRVCACKAILYRTAVIERTLAESLPKGPGFEGVEVGSVVAVRFAWRTIEGEQVFYFGRTHGNWLGLAHASEFRDFVL